MKGLEAAVTSLLSICLVLNIPSIYWHIKNKNLPAVVLLCVFELMCLKRLVDVSVWSGDDFFTTWDGKGWCDLMVRLELASYVSCYSSLFCLLLNLMLIFMVNEATAWWFSHRKTRLGFEIFCCITFPLIIMAMSEVALSRRYSLYKTSGCTLAFSKDRVSVLVFFIWIFLWCFLDMALTATTLALFIQKRKAASNILVCTNSGMNIKRFLRLLGFCVMILCIMILTCIYLGIQLRGLNSQFYDSDEHSSLFWNVILRYEDSKSVDMNKWIFIACSFIGFLAFGTGSDALSMYANGLRRLPYGARIVRSIQRINSILKAKSKQMYRTNHPVMPSPADSGATFTPDKYSPEMVMMKKKQMWNNEKNNSDDNASQAGTIVGEMEDDNNDQEDIYYDDPDIQQVLWEQERVLDEEKLHGFDKETSH